MIRHFNAETILRFAAFIFVLFADSAILDQCAGQGDWTQHQGTSSHSGYVPGTYDWSNFRPKWSFDHPSYQNTDFGLAVAMDAQNVYLNRSGPNDFELRWDVIAVDRLNGNEVWRTPIYPSSTTGLAPPSLANDLVYVGRYGHSSACGNECLLPPALVGLSNSTGVVKFEQPHSGQWDSGGRATPFGDRVFMGGGYYGGLNAFNSGTGAPNWFLELKQEHHWVPAADSEHVYTYMSGDRRAGSRIALLQVINSQSGEMEFEIMHPESTSVNGMVNRSVALGSPNHALAVGYTLGTSPHHILVDFDLQNRSVRWQNNGLFYGIMAVANGTIAIPNNDRLSVINEENGDTLWEWIGEGHVRGNVIMTDNLIFVNAGEFVHAIDRLTRQSVWSVNINGELALAHGTLVISNTDGVYAFDLIVPEPCSAVLLLWAIAACGLGLRRRGFRWDRFRNAS